MECFSPEKLYVLATEVLRMEPGNPIAAALQKKTAYSLLPLKRRWDKCMKVLEIVRPTTGRQNVDERTLRLLDMAVAQRVKPLLPEILRLRSSKNSTIRRYA